MASVDTRKLKDSVAEHLRKQKYDKAAETLEELVRAEPKDMQHRLKLGDAYRKLGSEEKAITSYRLAAKFFGDEGQLIKAIGALKVILEIDPRNEMAQRELADLNNRRFGKPTLEAANLKAPKGIGAGARGTSALELEEGQKAADEIAGLFETGKPTVEPGPDDEEPLELDDSDHSKPAPRKGVAPVFVPPAARQKGVVADRGAPPERRGPPKQVRPAYELGGGSHDEPLEAELEPLEEVLELDEPRAPAGKAPPARAAATPQVRLPPQVPPQEVTIDLDPASEIVETLPEEAFVAEAGSGGIELDMGAPAPKAPPAAAKARPPAPKPAPAAPPPPDDVIDLDDAVVEEEETLPAPRAAPPPAVIISVPTARPSGPPQPIAELLGGEAEEEIELLSITTEDELPPVPAASSPAAAALAADVDAAFGAIAPSVPPSAPPKKIPPKVPLFDDLPRDAFVALVNKLSYRRFGPGETIIQEGDPGRSFFVIVEGKVRVFKKLADGQDLQLAELGEGAFFGEMALLSGAARTAHVAALEDTELLEVTDVVLHEIVEKHPSVASSLKNFYRQRLINNVMAISPLFKDFDPSERKVIVERFRMRQGAAGEVFITEGKQSDGLYVVLHGAVRVVKKGEGDKEIELAKLKEGELFGEMSLLTRAPASATVSASGPCIVLKLPRENWQELMLTHPQILELVSDLTEKRRSATEAILSGMGAGHDGMSFV